MWNQLKIFSLCLYLSHTHTQTHKAPAIQEINMNAGRLSYVSRQLGRQAAAVRKCVDELACVSRDNSVKEVETTSLWPQHQHQQHHHYHLLPHHPLNTLLSSPLSKRLDILSLPPFLSFHLLSHHPICLSVHLFLVLSLSCFPWFWSLLPPRAPPPLSCFVLMP